MTDPAQIRRACAEHFQATHGFAMRECDCTPAVACPHAVRLAEMWAARASDNLPKMEDAS